MTLVPKPLNGTYINQVNNLRTKEQRRAKTSRSGSLPVQMALRSLRLCSADFRPGQPRPLTCATPIGSSHLTVFLRPSSLLKMTPQAVRLSVSTMSSMVQRKCVHSCTTKLAMLSALVTHPIALTRPCLMDLPSSLTPSLKQVYLPRVSPLQAR